MAEKARHRWSAEIASDEFHIDHNGATGTVIWQKPKELRLLAGAKMIPDADAPRIKDGSLGFAARFTHVLREENADKFDPKTWKTTEDIVLRSVNEIGNFLYFAGTNSWLVLKNSRGQTLNELSVVP